MQGMCFLALTSALGRANVKSQGGDTGGRIRPSSSTHATSNQCKENTNGNEANEANRQATWQAEGLRQVSALNGCACHREGKGGRQQDADRLQPRRRQINARRVV